MGWRGKIEIGVAVVLAASLFFIYLQSRRIRALADDRDRYKGNTESLLSDVRKYRVRDSLSAARVQALELTVKEFERFRAEDASLIRQLQSRYRDLSAVNKTLSETIIELRAAPKDTVIVRDSVPVPARKVWCGDEWYDFEGIVTSDTFEGTLRNRDELVLAETVQYRRFLGFLWKTRKVKSRELNCVSKNPHTEIMGVEHVVIEK